MFDTLLADVRYGLRRLWVHRGYALLAVLTLALGVVARRRSARCLGACLARGDDQCGDRPARAVRTPRQQAQLDASCRNPNIGLLGGLERRGSGASRALRPVLVTACRIEPLRGTGLPLLAGRTTQDFLETGS